MQRVMKEREDGQNHIPQTITRYHEEKHLQSHDSRRAIRSLFLRKNECKKIERTIKHTPKTNFNHKSPHTLYNDSHTEYPHRQACSLLVYTQHGWIQREGDRGPGPQMKNHKNIGFPSKTGSDPLKNHKATKPAFNGEPSSARKRNAI